jgi:hypothetical protein
MNNMFVVQTYCDVTNIHGERTIATKLHLVAPDGYHNVQNICEAKQIATIQTILVKGLFQHT